MIVEVNAANAIKRKNIADHNTFDKPHTIELADFTKAKIKNGILTVEMPAKSIVTIAVK